MIEYGNTMKAIAIAMIALMDISAVGMMPANVKAEADFIQGYWFDSNDGIATYWDGATGLYYGVLYAHTSEDPTDWTTSENNGGESDLGSYGTYSWDTGFGDDPFIDPPVAGDHIYISMLNSLITAWELPTEASHTITWATE